MFGYHDNDRCGFDLWSPVEERDTCDMTQDSMFCELYEREPHCATENRAFSPYAKHTQELEDVIQMTLAAARRGETNLSIELDDDFSDEDLAYIQKEVQRRF